MAYITLADNGDYIKLPAYPQEYFSTDFIEHLVDEHKTNSIDRCVNEHSEEPTCSCGEADISGLLTDAVKVLRKFLQSEERIPDDVVPPRPTLALDILRMANISREAE